MLRSMNICSVALLPLLNPACSLQSEQNYILLHELSLGLLVVLDIMFPQNAPSIFPVLHSARWSTDHLCCELLSCSCLSKMVLFVPNSVLICPLLLASTASRISPSIHLCLSFRNCFLISLSFSACSSDNFFLILSDLGFVYLVFKFLSFINSLPRFTTDPRFAVLGSIAQCFFRRYLVWCLESVPFRLHFCTDICVAIFYIF